MKITEVLLLDRYYEYKDFIEECSRKNYSDTLTLHIHHIIPKCIDKTIPDRFNTVKLSVDDHIKAHYLLAECFTVGSYERLSNIRAAKLLSKNSIKDKSLLEELYRYSIGEGNPFYGKTHNEETKKKLREATIKNRKNISYEDFYRGKASEEKKKRSNGVKKVWEKRTEEQKQTIAKKIKAALQTKNFSGGNNPNAKVVYVDEIAYLSVKDAQKVLNKSRYRLFKEHKIKFQ